MQVHGAQAPFPRLPDASALVPQGLPSSPHIAPGPRKPSQDGPQRREIGSLNDGRAPALPGPEGAPAADTRLRNIIGALQDDDDCVSGFILFDILQRVHQQGLNTQRTLHRGAQHSLGRSKRDEGLHTMNQVRGQDRSAWVNTAGLTSSALVSVLCAISGVDGLGQVASQATQVSQPVLNVIDRNSAWLGGTYHASIATLDLKDDAINSQGSNTAIEATRSAVDAGQEKLRQAFDLISSYLQRRADSLDRMAH